jgi:transposase
MKKLVIGIDVSKEKLDFCVQSTGGIMKELIVANTTSSIKSGLNSVLKELKIDMSEMLLCAEHTGHYNYPLCRVCDDLKADLWLENPAQIKYSSGLQRGKNDKLDARKIAAYTSRFQDRARLFALPEKRMASLKLLVSERDMYMADKVKYRGQVTDDKRFMSKEDYAAKCKRLKRQIGDLEAAIAEIERAIETLVNEDETLKRQRELLLSVDGVGKQTAIKMIVTTNAFRDFKNGRQFCCHAGVAPFSYNSGSSIRSKSRVSNRADKSIKTLLHMAALSVATRQKSGDLHEYYTRKVAEGKNKMLVLNAVRAKLVLRMFAVIKFNVFYDKNHAFEFA